MTCHFIITLKFFWPFFFLITLTKGTCAGSSGTTSTQAKSNILRSYRKCNVTGIWNCCLKSTCQRNSLPADVCAASDTLMSLQQNSGNKNVKMKTYCTVLMYCRKKKKKKKSICSLFSSSYIPSPHIYVSLVQIVGWAMCHISTA